jgi:putative endonuclease
MPIESGHISVGKKGEDLAVEYLIKKGYAIIHRNWRVGGMEIDIICKDKKGQIIFVEVKSLKKIGKSAFADLLPEDNVTKGKMRSVRSAVQMFVAKHSDQVEESSGIRIDVIALTISDKDVIINHYENAF